ncbi:MAG: c(7)-type cytochrome triheme domain-containing protein [Nitrospinaceae bacterium]
MKINFRSVIFPLFSILLTALFFHLPLNAAEEITGGDIWFKDTKKFKHVLFSHEKHLKAGNKCENCHEKIFHKKKGSNDKENAITMKVIKKGKFCGTCHNGETAFNVTGPYCKKCHVGTPKQK